MIPPPGPFLSACSFWARSNALPLRFDEPRVVEALEEAEALAERPADEPAAILFAFSKRPNALPEGWTFVERCALNLARVNLRAEIALETPDALDFLRLRVLANQASFDDVRAFIAARLRPIR